MANRKGVFIGAYVPNELKESLKRRAAAEHRTLSQEITRILVEAVHGQGLPSGSVDRRRDPKRQPLEGVLLIRFQAQTLGRFAIYCSGRKEIETNNFSTVYN